MDRGREGEIERQQNKLKQKTRKKHTHTHTHAQKREREREGERCWFLFMPFAASLPGGQEPRRVPRAGLTTVVMGRLTNSKKKPGPLSRLLYRFRSLQKGMQTQFRTRGRGAREREEREQWDKKKNHQQAHETSNQETKQSKNQSIKTKQNTPKHNKDTYTQNQQQQVQENKTKQHRTANRLIKPHTERDIALCVSVAGSYCLWRFRFQDPKWEVKTRQMRIPNKTLSSAEKDNIQLRALGNAPLVWLVVSFLCLPAFSCLVLDFVFLFSCSFFGGSFLVLQFLFCFR